MLKNEKINIPQSFGLFFSLYNNEKYIVLKKETKTFYCKIPNDIKFNKSKKNVFIFCSPNVEIANTKGFSTFLNNYIKTIEHLTKKTLLLKGLGLKVSLSTDKDILVFKLGFSHLIEIPVNTEKHTFLIGKNFLSIISIYKSEIGNLIEQIYQLKKIDCYKGRGFLYKNRSYIFKQIKKT